MFLDHLPGASTSGGTNEPDLPLLSEQITLEELWETLGECLAELGRTSDSHAVLVLQPAVEAFFLVHGTEKQVITAFVALSLKLSPKSVLGQKPPRQKLRPTIKNRSIFFKLSFLA